MKLIKTGLLLALFFVVTGVNAETVQPDGFLVKSSHYSVSETVDRLESILKKKGVTVFARINHAQGAEKAGLTLEPTELIIFGNPKLGGPLMISQRTVAIDVPLKAIVWQDKDGKVWLGYNTPEYIAKRHGIKDQPAIIKKMTGVLNKFTDYATKAQ